jgi:uncharacterized protein
MRSIVASALIFIAVSSLLSAAQQPTADVTAHAHAVLTAITANEYAKVEEQFTPEMKAALPPGRLAAMWSGLLNQAGPLERCGTDVRVRKIDDKQMVITPCEFERAKVDIQFAFDTAGRISGLAFRPVAAASVAYALPPYATPSSYSEVETTIGTGERVLPATLTMPAGTASMPGVVLVHGSGPNDRDETIGANKPFKDLAVGLASRGIAVLRYDKRTKVHPAKLAALTDFTVRQAVIDDVVEALKTVRAQPRVDASRVFVLGHSLGGMLVPRIASADATVAGFIVMAGPARPLEDAIVAQIRYLAEADGSISVEEQQTIDRAAALAEDIRGLKPEDAANGRMVSGAPASYWLDLRGYDPPSSAKSVRAPMLILQGERDYQVTTEEFAKWKAALGSRPDVTFHSYPALNHVFIAGHGRSVPAEYQVAGHVAEEVVRDVASWILTKR